MPAATLVIGMTEHSAPNVRLALVLAMAVIRQQLLANFAMPACQDIGDSLHHCCALQHARYVLRCFAHRSGAELVVGVMYTALGS
jgi:hypothetical protein